MKQLTGAAVLACLAVLAITAAGCSDEPDTSALYILEELDTAASVSDPGERIERLGIFIGNHPAHPYRLLGHRKIFETLAGDRDDLQAALRYYDDVLAAEDDPVVRGNILYRQFAYLWKAQKDGAMDLAEKLLGGDERYFRLFLYMGYYIMDEEGKGSLAERCFERAIDLAGNGVERAQAQAVLATHIESSGRREEAFDLALQASGNPSADELLGRLLWEDGKREQALESYIRLVAGRPGARSEVALDSLYALVHGSSRDLDERLSQEMISDKGTLPDGRFVDLDGREYSFGDYGDTPLVIVIWSPT